MIHPPVGICDELSVGAGHFDVNGMVIILAICAHFQRVFAPAIDFCRSLRFASTAIIVITHFIIINLSQTSS